MKKVLMTLAAVMFATQAHAVNVQIGSGDIIDIDTGGLNEDLLAGSGSTAGQIGDLLDSLPGNVENVVIGASIDDVIDGALDHTIGQDSAIDFVDEAAREAYEEKLNETLGCGDACGKHPNDL